MTQTAFEFLEFPKTTAKPRGARWTILSDRGLNVVDQSHLLDMVHDIVDRMKNVDHVGLLQRHPPDRIIEKNEICRRYGIGVFPGGVPFEIAYMQGKASAFFRRLIDLGFTGVEISADCIPPIAPDTRDRLIREATDLGLEVFTEVGYKRVGDVLGNEMLEVEDTVRSISADINAGALKVTIESNELTNFMQHEQLGRLIAIVEAVGLDRLVFEIGAGGKVNAELAIWLLEKLGSDVNVENIEPDRLLHFEAMRRGLSRAGNFKFFADRLAT